MMRQYFLLQYRMINRHLTAFGFHPFLGYAVIAALFAGLSWYLFNRFEYAAYGYALLSLTLTYQLSETRRNQFLQMCFPQDLYGKLRLAENTLVTLPFIPFLLVEGAYILAAGLCGLAALLALFHFERKLNFTVPTPFSKFPFEFTVGFRKTYVLMGFAYFLAVMSVLHGNFNLGVFSVIVLLLISLSYYSAPEFYYFVWIYNATSKGFLHGKIKTALWYVTLLCLPVLIVLSVTFPEHIDILAVLLVLGMAYITAMVLGKYAVFPSSLNLPQGLMIAVSFLFPPLLLVFIPYFYRKSVRQLQPILS